MEHALACHACDLLVDLPPLKHGQSASCPRCGAFLTRFLADAFDRVIAFASAGLVLLVLACSYPFLSFSAKGFENNMTLAATPRALWEYGMEGVACIVAAFIIIIPGMVLTLMLALCIPLRQQRFHAALPHFARTIFITQNWAMVEVFIIGVIVALVKIAAMATVVPGIAFWAYSAFTVCFILAVSTLDRVQCWECIEDLAG